MPVFAILNLYDNHAQGKSYCLRGLVKDAGDDLIHRGPERRRRQQSSSKLRRFNSLVRSIRNNRMHGHLVVLQADGLGDNPPR